MFGEDSTCERVELGTKMMRPNQDLRGKDDKVDKAVDIELNGNSYSRKQTSCKHCVGSYNLEIGMERL